MQIETELGPNYTFRNEFQKGCINVVYTSGFVFNFYERFFKRYELTFQQYNILRILRNKHPEPVSTSVLREVMLDKMSDVSRLVSRLEAKGFLTVSPNPVDKRLVNIVISDKGLRLLAEIDKELHVLDSMFQDLTEEEVIQLSNLLDKARASVRKMNL
ncbi:MarR family winged helix-turn-helix transcriptional regulator [Botryobacter ruber]|uniref:MarR family winged helix-turn-helix transcriptional regulator n=1 Tax=Botryobacter ruber TaxID=2171629 RepID=UPI000E0C6034|nr:MarR family transcriptional regulator [Botryobacter ruber]